MAQEIFDFRSVKKSLEVVELFLDSVVNNISQEQELPLKISEKLLRMCFSKGRKVLVNELYDEFWRTDLCLAARDNRLDDAKALVEDKYINVNNKKSIKNKIKATNLFYKKNIHYTFSPFISIYSKH